jgi:hypothetical protein
MAAGPKALSTPDNNGLKTINVADGTLATDGASTGQVTTAEINAKARANHTGTAPASTISDFDIQVRTSRLDQMAAPTTALQHNAQRAANVAAATTDTDAPQWGQVKDLISGQRKTDVRFATSTNDTLSGLAVRDSVVTPVAGDRALVTGQTTASANGIYVAAAGAWARAADADVSGEFATQWLVTVQEGTAHADSLWKHSTDAVVTLGTTALLFTKVGPIASSASDGYTTTCPITAAGATWTVTHNLGTRALLAAVARAGSPWDYVNVRIERPTINTLAVMPDLAFAAGEYEIMVKRVV